MTSDGSPALLCLLVDAFRHDYLSADRSPRLASLATEGVRARITPILGYSDSIRATIFTGRYPEEHGYWMEYCYRPESSPFSRMTALAPLDRIPSDVARRAIKFGLSATWLRRRAEKLRYESLSIRNTPFAALGAFDRTLRGDMRAPGVLPFPTIFERTASRGFRWTYLDSAKIGRRGVLTRIRNLRPDTKLVFVYLHYIDLASHLFGVGAAPFWTVVRGVDSLAGQILDQTRRILGDVQVLVFSDHGMSNVLRNVSLNALMQHPSFMSHFCCALDSTMVRVWYLNEGDGRFREEIRSSVSERLPGRWLERNELKSLHLDFDHRLYGDEIFLTEPGNAIFPNFHSYVRPRAMHAYHPAHPEQHGIFIGPGGLEVPEGEPVELTAIARFCDRLLEAPV